MAEEPLTLVVGAGGLLGSAVVRELGRQAAPFVTAAVPWDDSDRAVTVLGEAVDELTGSGRPWRIVWSAGAGVIGTGEQQLRSEIVIFEGFLGRLEQSLRDSGTRAGALFVTSSAGGVYAGSSDPPFTEDTEPVPISPYGYAKLASERSAAEFSRRTGLPTAIGRVSNLYGPGQDITKPQGLISQLCRAHLFREPISIYVPLDTARDYLFVDDAARMVLGALELAAEEGGVHTRVLASEQATTVGVILAELRRVTKRRPQVVLGVSPLAKFQVKDLRFRSLVRPPLRQHVTTPLPAGVAATFESVGADMRAGRLAPACR